MSERIDYLPKDEVARLRQISGARGLAGVLGTWFWISACLALYVAYPSVLTFAIGWVIISGRHLALAILMHDGAHRLLLRNKKWNDVVGQWLTAYPTMVDMMVYRNIYLIHHNNTWTDKDPDLHLAIALPVTKASFRRKMLRDLTGQTAYKRHRIYVRYACGLDPRGTGLGGVNLFVALRNFVVSQRGFVITNGLMLAGLSALGHWEAFFLLWWLPSWTGYSVVLRLRSIAEHACITEKDNPLRNTRTTLASWWVRFLIAPHHVNYHLEHHLFMMVPHYNLPRAHRLLREAGVLDNAEVVHGYREVLRMATSKPEAPPKAAAAAA